MVLTGRAGYIRFLPNQRDKLKVEETLKKNGIQSFLKRLAIEDLTIVIILHDPYMAFLFGDDFLFVHGRQVFHEPAEKPWYNPILKQIFFEHIDTIPCGDRAIIIPKPV